MVRRSFLWLKRCLLPVARICLPKFARSDLHSHTDANHSCRETAAKRKPHEKLPEFHPLFLTSRDRKDESTPLGIITGASVLRLYSPGPARDTEASAVQNTVFAAPQTLEAMTTAAKKAAAKTQAAKTKAAKKPAAKKAAVSKAAVRATAGAATDSTGSGVGNDNGAFGDSDVAEVAAATQNYIAPSGPGHTAVGADGEVVYKSIPEDTAASDEDAPPKKRVAKKAAVKEKPAKETTPKKTAVKEKPPKKTRGRYDDDAVLYTAAPEVMADEDVEALIQEKLPETIFSRLFPFQREGVRFGVKHQGRVLLGDEMGLGKTMQASFCLPSSSRKQSSLVCL